MLCNSSLKQKKQTMFFKTESALVASMVSLLSGGKYLQLRSLSIDELQMLVWRISQKAIFVCLVWQKRSVFHKGRRQGASRLPFLHFESKFLINFNFERFFVWQSSFFWWCVRLSKPLKISYRIPLCNMQHIGIMYK